MILATDLDGTFLGGSESDRAELYRIIRSMPDATLIFVTGRGLDSIRPLLADPHIPDPDYIIADVGATVVDGHTLQPIDAVQEPIDARWPGAERVRDALSGFDALIYQEVPQERRCSFFVRDGAIPADLPVIVERELECDLLLSAGRYLDVLPAGVSKGSTLLALLEHADLDHERVVVAGDTLNDLSLFECDLKGIVVGGAETELRDRVNALGGARYLARAEGGGGIIEGLRHHGLLPKLSRDEDDPTGGAPGSGAPGDGRRRTESVAFARAASAGAAAGGSAGTPPRAAAPIADTNLSRREARSTPPRAAASAASAREIRTDRPTTDPTGAAAADRQLVMVYHRLPFDEVRRGGKTIRRRPKSPNGIIPTLLGFFDDGQKGMWVAWSKQETREPADWKEEVSVDADRYPNLSALRIPLTPGDVNLFYEAFSKEAFWPVIFSFPDRAEFNAEHWDHYLEINRIFAEHTARVAEPGALVWVHDYNLWMVPHFLRELRPDVKIAFFHHTAFPSSDIFNIIPWRRQIVESLLQCDYIGFHIPHYVQNFVNVVRTHAPMEVIREVPTAPRFVSFGCAIGVDEMTTELEVLGRRVRLGAHPVGINVRAIQEILDRPDTRDMMARIRHDLGDRTVILSIERLDYVKGPLEKLQAFEKLLEDHPELHGKIVLLTVTTPPAPGMRVYRRTRERVDEAVGRINGRFSQLDWTPVRYFYRALPYEEVIAHYAVSDVAWITPLRDGLNMVAKEYIAANSATGGKGTLVLSEFAGAAAELHGALLTNPYSPSGMAEDLHRALTLSDEERGERMALMNEIVETNNIAYWSYEFLASVDGKL